VKKDKNYYGGLFIPGGLLVGMGIGFLVNNIAAGLFIGLGAGFILFGIVALSIKSK
jgi:hypothetical protein